MRTRTYKRGNGEAREVYAFIIASFPVLLCTRFTFTCDNCGGEHFETGSETSREVDVGTIVYTTQSTTYYIYKCKNRSTE